MNPSSPGIDRQANRYEKRLRAALSLAAKRDSRKSPTNKAIYATVRTVKGFRRAREAIIEFTAAPFRGGLFQSYDWTGS